MYKVLTFSLSYLTTSKLYLTITIFKMLRAILLIYATCIGPFFFISRFVEHLFNIVKLDHKDLNLFVNNKLI